MLLGWCHFLGRYLPRKHALALGVAPGIRKTSKWLKSLLKQSVVNIKKTIIYLEVPNLIHFHYHYLLLSFFFFGLFFDYYRASAMDKLLSAKYLISSEWYMQQCGQFTTVVGFVDIKSCVWEKTMRKQNKNKIK